MSDAVYVHDGTGNTPSDYYCPVCDGFYGVPHDDVDHSKHPHCLHCAEQCACRACQIFTDTYPTEGHYVNRAIAFQIWGIPQ